RQRIYNIVLLEHLAALDERYGWVANDLGGARGDLDSHARRIEMLEGSRQADWTFVLRHNDALFARVDQKLDRYRGEARRLWGDLGAALVELEAARPESVAALGQAREEYVYRELEHYHRGTPEELENRFTPHLEALRGRRRVLDLGCGRGEALEILGRHGVGARGVDGNARMVEACRERGLEAEQGDLFDTL